MSDTIFYEDNDILLFNKAPGTLVHPSVNEKGSTLYDLALHHLQEYGISCGAHPVSRLDRYTSGLVLFAKKPSFQHWLSLPQANFTKEYLAIIRNDSNLAQRGTIDAPIARKAGSIIERCIDFQHGKAARSDYEILKRFAENALLRVSLLSGRTHQIRVHLAYLGFPLIGDNLYGQPGAPSRHALHAFRISFCHPVSEKTLVFSCALPEDLQSLLK